ncbi:Alpha/Beta hydrolase protein [Lasiosphaeris hirsuta]|uniref:Alpha/Beta hydrolase protein n=1 Tax=Lasiosphaeris hirsuta TaxID=260670 RepID=A0AA40A9K8_9PEZI|nr:Alpha/Beta hydrolase protein [Lasiosphaeris hirsuta]
MHYDAFTANDGTRLAFQTSLSLINPSSPKPHLPYTRCILLLHGFSGSSTYFIRNTPTLSTHHWVVAPDLRGHGRSGHSAGGYHVARLAMDLHEFLEYLRIATDTPNIEFIPVGCSIGAAVLWTYIELFGASTPFTGMVFVDQAPLQDRSPFFGWHEGRAHTGCYDEATMMNAQSAWIEQPAAAARGLVAECLGYRFMPREEDPVGAEQRSVDEEFFVEISGLCDGQWLARLIADHTRYDHREALELITVPIVVMLGKQSGCFTREGMLETASRVRGVKGMEDKVVVSEFKGGHWLFYEEADRFNRELLEFVDSLEP